MKRRLLPLVAICFLPVAAGAVSTPSELLPNPAQERRAEQIGQQLRCVVCQNQSVEDSDAPIAHDLRQVIRQKIVAGQTDHAIMQWMVKRYGDFILLKPPVLPLTWLLWGSPVIGLMLATAAMALRPRGKAPAPLTPEERARIERLASDR